VPEEEQEEELEQQSKVGARDFGSNNETVFLASTVTPQFQVASITKEQSSSQLGHEAGRDISSQPLDEPLIATSGFGIDFDDSFKLHSLDLQSPAEETPLSPTQPAPPIHSRKRSASPKKHWTLPALTAAPTVVPSRRPISDDNGSSGSSLSSANRSYSAVTLNPDSSSFVQLSPVTTIKPVRQRKSILNPMNLLSRRRTSQGLDQDPQVDFAPFGTVIRGKGVHDFDKPRPCRNLSTNDLDGYNAYSRGDVTPVEEYKRRIDIPWSTSEMPPTQVMETAREQSEQQHAPMFREHFEDDGTQTGLALRREDLVNQEFLNRVHEQVSGDSASPSPPLPATKEAQVSAPIITAQSEELEEPVRASTPNPPAINIIEGTPIPENDTTRMFPGFVQGNHSHNETQPVEQDWQLETPTPRLHRPSEASDTSRFSFMPGDLSAEEERKLEQRHMEKVTQEQLNRPAAPAPDDDEQEDEESDEDYVSDYGEEGSFYNEESVPEIGGDSMLDEDQTVRRDVNLPRSIVTDHTQFAAVESGPLIPSMELMQHGLGLILGQDGGLTTFPSYMQPDHNDAVDHSALDDDMYFDDGLIGEPSPLEGESFDESVFDRDIRVGEGLPLANKQSGNIQFEPGQTEEGEQETRVASSDYLDPHDSATGEDGDVTPVKRPMQDKQYHREDTPINQRKLDAYHNALANATAKAEASGRFNDEAMSPLQRYAGEVAADEEGPKQFQHSEYDYQQDQQQAPIYWQPSLDDDDDQPYWQGNDYDDFDPSLNFNSDDIAAANAEALAADESGFYGREFGSFFGNTANNTGLNRNRSVREPILTPITERSEFSRAPSFMSMGSPLFGPSSFVHGPQGNSPALPSIPFHSENGFLHPSSPALPSPGLRELAGRVGLNHDDLTLKQLMKLRQDALGTAGMSPVTAHFNSPHSPNLGVYGQFAGAGGVLPSSPLAGRSANLPTLSPMAGQHDVKIGSVPDSARRKTLRSSSLGTAIVNSSPPRLESPGSADGGYFAPNSPSSPFSHTSDVNNDYYAQYVEHGAGEDEEGETDYDQFDETDEPEVSTTPPHQPGALNGITSSLLPTTPDKQSINPPLRSHPISPEDLLQLGELPLDSRTSTPVPIKMSSSSSIGLPLLPPPPPSLLEKFAARPPASSKTFEEREAERKDEKNEEAGGVESVAYVQDEQDETGQGKWYVEKRKTLVSGEVLVLGTEEVVGGRI